MDRNLASILALAGTAAISVTLAAIAPGDAYAEGTKNQYVPLAPSGASVDYLKRLYLECDRASVEGRLTQGEAMLCSTVYEALKRHAFDGDFDKLLAWSRTHALQPAGRR